MDEECQHCDCKDDADGVCNGSIAAYCVGITDIDPIRYNLIFERFLNPERVSMPDFDLGISGWRLYYKE